jgi:hypothetical protein
VSEDLLYVDVEPGLLADLTASRLREGLAGLDPSSGNRPQALRRRARAAHDEDPAGPVAYDRADAWDPYHPAHSPLPGHTWRSSGADLTLGAKNVTPRREEPDSSAEGGGG